MTSRAATDSAMTPALMAHMEWFESNPLMQWIARDKRHSQRLVASMIGVSTNTVYYWVHGTKTPNPKHFDKLAEITAIDNIQDEWETWIASRP